jgi:hypothetical protein
LQATCKGKAAPLGWCGRRSVRVTARHQPETEKLLSESEERGLNFEEKVEISDSNYSSDGEEAAQRIITLSRCSGMKRPYSRSRLECIRLTSILKWKLRGRP